MTFSLVGRCARTGMLGAVVASSSPAVGARCAWARARVGAACTQNVTDPLLGRALLDRLQAGLGAQEAINEIVAEAPRIEYRQLSVVDANGETAVHSGSKTLGRHATATGAGCAAAGNLLASTDVPSAMVEAFSTDPRLHLGDRLLASLRAGLDAGGEEGSVHACGLVIVDRVDWYVTDLRVDWREEDPIDELARIWTIWKPQADDYVLRAMNPAAAPSFHVPGDE